LTVDVTSWGVEAQCCEVHAVAEGRERPTPKSWREELPIDLVREGGCWNLVGGEAPGKVPGRHDAL
jgi:hypothetical protein